MELGEILILKRRINELCMRPPGPPTPRVRPRPGLGGGGGRSSQTPSSPLSIGYPIAMGATAGRRTNDFKLAVHLQDIGLSQNQAFLNEVNDIAQGETEIIYVGEIRPSAAIPWHQQHNRPLLVGSSVSWPGKLAGTIGLITTDQQGKHVLVSNNHVLSPDNGSTVCATIQPGGLDGGQMPNDRIGKLKHCVKIGFQPAPIPTPQNFNYADAACVELDDGVEYDQNIPFIGPILGMYRPSYTPIDVQKVGRKTGHTKGQVVGINVGPFWLHYPNFGYAWFDEQLSIKSTNKNNFSQKGDSGSLIVDQDGYGVGLLFAESGHGPGNPLHRTYANPLVDVLATLDLLPLDK
jgi:hypothetical protein